MLDVTDIPEARMGDIAVVAGSEGGESVTFDDMARWAGTINYDKSAASPSVCRV